jgi:5-hydroxyisourate hydrolase-like protein (transthyretin family)
MRLPASLILSLMLLVFCGVLCPSQTVSAKRNTEATVSGKVTIKGKPAPGVVVGLRSARPTEGDATFKAATDQEGNYRIIDLPAGSYWIAPVAPAFVIRGMDESSGKPLIVSADEHVEGIDFELIRGGVITGKVVDAEGHPVVEERVSLIVVGDRNRGTHTEQVHDTDDRGIYRMFGIPPGNYKVLIGMDGSFFSGAGRGRPTHRPTFYPDATDVAQATVIEIAEGTEVTRIDFTLGPLSQGYSVSGRVLDESGNPVPNAPIALTRITHLDANRTSGFVASTGTRSDKQGEFRVENLSPGKYSVTVSPPAESDMRPEAATFDLLDQDVTGLVIKTSNGASVAGILVLEGAKGTDLMSNLSEPFMEVNVTRENSTWGRSVPINPDGSFRVGGLDAGIVKFSIESTNRLTVSQIERDGVAQPNAIQIQNGEHLNGIRVVLVRRNGSARGVIKVENGVLPANGRFVVQLTKAEDPSGNVASADVDSRGHFLVEGLAGGNYELRVFAYVPGSSQRLPSARQLVSVTEGAVTEITVTLDFTATPDR